MKIGIRQIIRSGSAKMTLGAVVLALFHNGALGADIPADSLKIAAGVVKASGYETPSAKNYIVANSTNIYGDHAVYGTNVTGQLKLGEKVEALAKVKGWDWMVVGKEGTGIGYVPISMLAPEDKYVPPPGGSAMNGKVERTGIDLDKWLGLCGLLMSSLLILSLVVR